MDDLVMWRRIVRFIVLLEERGSTEEDIAKAVHAIWSAYETPADLIMAFRQECDRLDRP